MQKLLLATVLTALLVGGCGGSTSSPRSESSNPSPTPSSAPSATPAASAAAVFGRDTVVVTVEGGVRVRSKPEVSDEALKLEPLLEAGTSMFVVDGPVVGSGYDWYDVLPISFDHGAMPEGWVAAASRDGAPWIAPAHAVCPATPSTRDALKRMSRGAALACFAGIPLTFEARIVSCNCEADGPAIVPSWFGVGSLPLLNDPNVTSAGDPTSWLAAKFDPAGEIPDPLPLDQTVQITGQFDHPAARSCQWEFPEEMQGDSPVIFCRTIFAVTKVQPAATATSTIVLRRAPDNLGCDSIGLSYSSATIRIDPSAAEQVWAEVDTLVPDLPDDQVKVGDRLAVYWSPSFRAGSVRDPTVRDGSGAVIARDGTRMGELKPYFVCAGTHSLYVLDYQPG